MGSLMNQKLPVSTIQDKSKKSVGSYNVMNNSATGSYIIINYYTIDLKETGVFHSLRHCGVDNSIPIEGFKTFLFLDHCSRTCAIVIKSINTPLKH